MASASPKPTFSAGAIPLVPQLHAASHPPSSPALEAGPAGASSSDSQSHAGSRTATGAHTSRRSLSGIHKTQFTHSCVQAVGLVGTTAYMSYLVSDHLGLSGIVTLFCCSVCMSHYALHSLTKTQRAATLSSFETLSYLAEGSIFVYVGLDALDPEKWAVRSLLGVMILLAWCSRMSLCRCLTHAAA